MYIQFEIFDDHTKYSLSENLKHCRNDFEKCALSKYAIEDTLQKFLKEIYQYCNIELTYNNIENTLKNVMEDFKNIPLKGV